MRTILLSSLLAATVFGQAESPTQSRVITVTHAGSFQEFQEMAILVRTMTEIKDLSGDNATMAITARGTAEQIGLAEWLVKQLDQPAGSSVSPGVLEYKTALEYKTGDDVVRVLYLPHTATVQDFQEAANATRTITEIRRTVTYNPGRAMVVRGPPDQVAWAEWVAADLDKPAEGSAAHEYRIKSDDMIRVFRIANAKTVQDFQEIANATRTMAEIRRVFTYNTGRAIAMRGTPEELGMADWLLKQFDKTAPQTQASEEFRAPGTGDDVTRVFYLPQSLNVMAFQQAANQIRTKLQIRRVFTYNSLRAMSVRGTASQLALAAHMLDDLEQAKAAQ